MLSEKSYFGIGKIPVGIGAILKGWDITEAEFRSGVCAVDFRAMTEACPHDCFHCFTDKIRRTMSLDQIKKTIDEIAVTKAKSINFLGEGEPTIDPNFFEIIEYTATKGIVPIIFTDAATQLRERDFVKRLFDSGASVCPKCDSLFDSEYQNWVVCDRSENYFYQRNVALASLMYHGFNKVNSDGSTRLGFVMVVTRYNIKEVPATLRYCRMNNVWIVFSTYLPTGRSKQFKGTKDLCPSRDELNKMRGQIQAIDSTFNFKHQIWNNFATMPCIERVQIYGDGRVTSCSGSDLVIGDLNKSSYLKLHNQISKLPAHDFSKFQGFCPYRPAL